MTTSKKKKAPGKKRTTRVKRATKKVDPEVDLEARIRHRAYELYLERGRSKGDAVDDWIAAEREITRGQASE